MTRCWRTSLASGPMSVRQRTLGLDFGSQRLPDEAQSPRNQAKAQRQNSSHSQRCVRQAPRLLVSRNESSGAGRPLRSCPPGEWRARQKAPSRDLLSPASCELSSQEISAARVRSVTGAPGCPKDDRQAGSQPSGESGRGSTAGEGGFRHKIGLADQRQGCEVYL